MSLDLLQREKHDVVKFVAIRPVFRKILRNVMFENKCLKSPVFFDLEHLNGLPDVNSENITR